jgi:hypothetical protein
VLLFIIQVVPEMSDQTSEACPTKSKDGRKM